MKQIVAIIGLVFFSAACGNRTTVKLIEFEIYNTQQYCGGARPTDDIKKELTTPKPTSDTFYIYNSPDRMGTPVQLIVEKGKGAIPYLNEGDYMAFKYSHDEFKRQEGSPDPMAGCYMDFYRHVYFTFSVTPETTMISDTVQMMCNPCIPPAP